MTRAVFVGVSSKALAVKAPYRFVARVTEFALAEIKQYGCDVLIIASATCRKGVEPSTLDNTFRFLEDIRNAGRWPRLAIVITRSDAELTYLQHPERPLLAYSADDLERFPEEFACKVARLVN